MEAKSFANAKRVSRMDFAMICTPTFTDWSGIFDAARRASILGALDEAVHEQVGTSNILERMRRIDRVTVTNIRFRESLGIRQHSLQVIRKSAEKRLEEISKQAPDSASARLTERCMEVSTSLDHCSILAKGSLEQLENLLSMMASLEQISLGQSIGCLNVLAFTFLPLSFIAVSPFPSLSVLRNFSVSVKTRTDQNDMYSRSSE